METGERVYQISYEAKLNSEVLIRTTDGDPNLVESAKFLPGSALCGAIANWLILENKLTAQDARFQSWFLKGELSFLNGYLYQFYSPNGLTRQRFLPCPLSLRKDKTKPKNLFDISIPTKDEVSLPVNTTGVSGFIYLEGSSVYLGSVEAHYNYHTTRQNNRRYGRATGEGGGVFVYEALQPNQTFAGYILGSQTDLNELVDLVGQKTGSGNYSRIQLQIGRSRAVQYGGDVTLQLGQVQPFRREIASPQSNKNVSQIVLTLLSPLLARASNGYSKLSLPLEQLATRLGYGEQEKIKIINAYQRSVTVGGYSTIWQLPRPQQTALAAGSVFILALPRPLRTNEFSHLEAIGLGERTGEGFGRFVLDWHGQVNDLTGYEIQTDASWLQTVPTHKPAELVAMIDGIIQAEWLRHAERVGLSDANHFIHDKISGKAALKEVSPALLGRLQEEFGQISAGKSRPKLDQLRPIARRQLERLGFKSMPEDETSRISLLERLEKALALKKINDEPLNIKELKTLKANLVPTGWQWTETGPDYEKLLAALIRRYLLTLIQELSKQRRLLED